MAKCRKTIQPSGHTASLPACWLAGWWEEEAVAALLSTISFIQIFFFIHFESALQDNPAHACTKIMQYSIEVFYKKNGPTLASFLFIFGLFKTNYTIFISDKCEKCPSSIQWWDSNSQHVEHESSPITTRPGLRPVVHREMYQPLRFGLPRYWDAFCLYLEDEGSDPR